MTEITQDITKGKLLSAYVVTPFDEAKKALEAQGYRIISLEENARLRIQEGSQAYVSQYGNWTREGFIYAPKKGVFLTKNSPIMDNAIEATACHRHGNEFYLDKEQVEKALENSVKIQRTQIQVNEFKNDELTVFAFGKEAEAYGEFLKECGITKMSIYLADIEKKPFARQLWFGSLDGGSELDGGDRYLDIDGRARGVRESESVEGTAKNVAKNYTQEQISRALKQLGISGLEKQILNTLKQNK